MTITAATLMVQVGANTKPAQQELGAFSRSLSGTFTGGIRQAENFASSFNRTISGISSGISQGLLQGVGFGAMTMGLTAVTSGLQGLVADAAGAYMETERLTMSLQAMTAQELVNAGAAADFGEGLAMAGDRAGELLGWVKDLAIASPFGSQDIAGMLRLGMVYGFNSEQAKRLTEATTDFGAALGLSGQDMERVVRALGQVNQRGKLTSNELNQLSEVGVPGLRILADAAGVSSAEMQKMVEQGLVPAGPAIEAITQKFESYEGAADANAGTLGGIVASLDDLKTFAEVDFFGPMFKEAQPYLDSFVTTLKDEEVQAAIKTMGAALGIMAGNALAGTAESIGEISQTVSEWPTEQPGWLSGLLALDSTTLRKDITVDVTPTGSAVKFVGWFGDGGIVTLDADMNIVDVNWNFGGGFGYDGTKLTYTGPDFGVGAFFNNLLGMEMTLTNWSHTLGVNIELGFSNLLALEMELTNWSHTLGVNIGLGFNNLLALEMDLTNWAAGLSLDAIIKILPDFGAFPGWLMEQMGWDDGTSSSGGDYGNVTPANINGRRNRIPGGANGFENFPGGWAIVGEKGPELLQLPGGSNVFTNADTLRMLAGLGVPGFADGTPGAKPPVFPSLSSSFGNVGDLKTGIKEAGKDFAKSVKEASKDFEGALRSTPGLLGTSKVTADQMKMASLGVPQNFADDYLRQLTDEVVNGVDWANVDIGEAAAAAGIDPNLPAQAILQMFSQAWSDSSLFANPENLKFINQDAVKKGIERQQASQAGESNIMAMFGIGEEDLVNQIAGLGLQLETGLQQYLADQGLGPVGAQAAASIGTGIKDNGAVMGDGMNAGFSGWTTSEEGFSALKALGAGLVPPINTGFKDAVGNLDWSVPVKPGTPPAPGGSGNTPPANPPAFANGTSWFAGGMALVGEEGPELVRLPRGSSVLDARSTAALAPVTVVVNATVNQPHDIELLARRVARMIQHKRG